MFPELTPGSTFGQGRYEIRGELGRGGMGRVLLAFARHLERLVVIKVLQAIDNEQHLMRFQREAQALAQARHRYVVPVHEFGLEGQFPFIVMGYIEGETLEEFVVRAFREGDGPDEEWVRDFFLKLIEALDSLHSQGLVHRDVKPANILIARETGDPILVDFGLAKMDPAQFRATMESLTQTGQFVGTPGFMPPEQLDTKSGLGEVGAASDIWGFGATLFYTLTGQQPFQGRTLIELAAALVSLEAPRLRSVRPEAPLWLDELCHQCLRQAVIERPGTDAIIECLTSSGARGLKIERSSKGVYVLLLCLLAMIGAGGVFWHQSRDVTDPVLLLKETRRSIATNRGFFEIVGKVEDENPSHVLVGKKRVEVSESGVFRCTETLKAGEQVISLVAFDKDGRESAVERLTVRLDQEPPSFTLDPVTTGSDGHFLIRGRASEDLRSVRYQSQRGQVKGERFSFTLKLAEYDRDGVLVFEDLAGNEARLKMPLVIVGQTKSSSFGTFTSALKKARSGDTFYLLPGRYKMISRPRLSLNFVGLGAREEVVLYARNRALLELSKVRVTFKNLSLDHQSRSGAGIEGDSGQLEIENCVLRLEGFKSFRLGGRNTTISVKARNCRFLLEGREGSKFSKCQVKFQNVHITDQRQLIVEGDNLELLTFEDCPKVSWSWVNLSHSRAGGILMTRTFAEMENCELHHCVKRALVLNGGRLKLRGSAIHSNRYAGLSLRHQASGLALACQFWKNGGSISERLAGIHLIDRSKLTMIGSEIRDHNYYGIVAMDDCEVTLQRCTLKNNKPGDFYGEFQGSLIKRN